MRACSAANLAESLALEGGGEGSVESLAIGKGFGEEVFVFGFRA